MKKRKKIKYEDKLLGKVKIVNDFLPKPKELVLMSAVVSHQK